MTRLHILPNMSPREVITLSYWRASQAALAGNVLGGHQLMIVSVYQDPNVAKIADAACRSLEIAAQRVAR